MTATAVVAAASPSVYPIDNINNAKISIICKGLYVGGICKLSPETIAKLKINLIINTTAEVPNFQSCGKIGILKLWIKNEPNAYFLSQLDAVCDQIHLVLCKGGRVLIHSVQGVSRCATICLAYLMKYKFESLKDAFIYMSGRRPTIQPPTGFWRQLIAFEQDLTQTLGSVKIVRDNNDPTKLIPDVYQLNIEPMKTESECQVVGRDRSTVNWESNHSDQESPIISTTSTRWSRKSSAPLRRNSLSNKFRPVLDALLEVDIVAC